MPGNMLQQHEVLQHMLMSILFGLAVQSSSFAYVLLQTFSLGRSTLSMAKFICFCIAKYNRAHKSCSGFLHYPGQ